jgi:electron-transferring-flavoprotein dehydrogenase
VPDLQACLQRTSPIGCHGVAKDLLCVVKYSFFPAADNDLMSAMDYKNPYLSPCQEFRRWKTNSCIKKHLEGGTCISYGARALNEGGLQAIPKLTFSGGGPSWMLGGFFNVPKIKGSHTAMKSEMLAGEQMFAALAEQSEETVALGSEMARFRNSLYSSWGA